MAIKINKYHDLGLEELNKELQNKKDALFNMRFQKSLQQLDNPLTIKNLKKDIARIKTRMNAIKKFHKRSQESSLFSLRYTRIQ